jgi:DNA invertase Pin-like site-specific DNA recombinase
MTFGATFREGFGTAMKRVGLYLRVSTDGQTTENQRLALMEVAGRSDWQVVKVFEDRGISGAKGRDKRPEFDKLLRAITRRQIDLVAAWSVDRLSRSMQDLVGFLSELQGCNCNLYLHQQGLDTSTPTGRAMFQMCGIFAELERAILIERINAGIARARVKGTKSGAPIGRAKVSMEREDHVRALLGQGIGIGRAARMAGVGTSVAQRVKLEMAA